MTTTTKITCITETATTWIDENNNSWNKINYTFDDAYRISSTLTNCTNCEDCTSCENCENCVGCTDCTDCTGCNELDSCDSIEEL